MHEHLVVLTTVGSEEDAVALASAVVGRRLAACANVLPAVRSLYRWKGGLQDEREHMLVMKTRADRFDELARAFEELHPYEVPELIALSVVRGAAGYLGWIDECVSADSPDSTE